MIRAGIKTWNAKRQQQHAMTIMEEAGAQMNSPGEHGSVDTRQGVRGCGDR